MAVTWVLHSLSVGILIYQKNGLKRGPGIPNATFRSGPPRWVPDDNRFFVTPPSLVPPLSGGSPGPPLYRVRIEHMRRIDEPDPVFNLEVGAPRHYWQSFRVRNGEQFEVRLDRI